MLIVFQAFPEEQLMEIFWAYNIIIHIQLSRQAGLSEGIAIQFDSLRGDPGIQCHRQLEILYYSPLALVSRRKYEMTVIRRMISLLVIMSKA